jgi:Na+-translocating ferredoxin:NAD+ oxidoreductase subunit B
MENNNDVYRKLQQHLDKLPVGYPATESGVEIRLLKHLFDPREAELATRLSIIPEPMESLYPKFEGLDLSEEKAEEMLERLAEKGAITGARNHKTGKMVYANALLAVGIFEYQVGRLTEDFARDFQEYMHGEFKEEVIKTPYPQMRTIPIEQSITVENSVKTYDDVRELIKSKDYFSVANCVCRESNELLEKNCTHTKETCLQFGGAGRMYVERGLAREITREEALNILEKAQKEGLVLQPSNSKKPNYICCCCGCACEILTTAKRLPKPSEFFATNHFSYVDADSCSGCGACVDICPMEALEVVDDISVVDLDRCIGCGVCVPACPADAIELKKKDKEKVPPENTVDLYMKIMQDKARMTGNE